MLLTYLTISAWAETDDQDVVPKVEQDFNLREGQVSESSSTAERVTYTSTDKFEEDVIESDLPVLVVFTAPWCGPCKILDPVIETLMPEMSGEAGVFKLDTDVSPEISSKFNVTRLPTIVYFNEGQESYRMSTIYPRDAYINCLQGLNQNIFVEESIVRLLDEDWFRRHFLVTEEVETIEKYLETYPDLLTKNFDNGQSPISFILNYPSNTRRDLMELVLSQAPEIRTNDLVGLGRCEEFKQIVENNPDAINRPDPDGNTPLFTAIMGSSLQESGECVGTVLELGAERSLPNTIRNSLGELVPFRPDNKLVEELLDILPKKWGPKWYNDEVGVKNRMLFMEMYKVRNVRSEELIASRAQ
ncbi:MAG: hypothetical protein F4W92_00965 [Gammaproteobacteria bacterium]|nr:hypothetical protein [Gammaproteobacteria bacterium]